MDKMRELEAPPSPLGYSAMQPDDPHRGRIGQGTIASKVRLTKSINEHVYIMQISSNAHILSIYVCAAAW